MAARPLVLKGGTLIDGTGRAPVGGVLLTSPITRHWVVQGIQVTQ